MKFFGYYLLKITVMVEILKISISYTNLQDQYKDEQFIQCRAILASTIEIVDQINDYVLSKILVDMSNTNDSETFNILTPEFLNSLATSGVPNHNIKLKVGTPIMVLRNLDQYE
ncbi:hypothetical protein Lal_00032064 [Lupinus albus]|nr:hypothetical protein Lal_00032064 [Lupinus albus]